MSLYSQGMWELPAVCEPQAHHPQKKKKKKKKKKKTWYAVIMGHKRWVCKVWETPTERGWRYIQCPGALGNACNSRRVPNSEMILYPPSWPGKTAGIQPMKTSYPLPSPHTNPRGIKKQQTEGRQRQSTSKGLFLYKDFWRQVQAVEVGQESSLWRYSQDFINILDWVF